MHGAPRAEPYPPAMPAAPHRAISLAIGGFIAMAAAMGIGRFVYTPILPFMAEGIGLTKPPAGLIASANFLGYLLGALAAASPFLPGGKRGWFIAALAGSALSTAAMGLVAPWGPFFCSGWPAASPAPSSWSFPRRWCWSGWRPWTGRGCRRCISPASARASRSRP